MSTDTQTLSTDFSATEHDVQNPSFMEKKTDKMNLLLDTARDEYLLSQRIYEPSAPVLTDEERQKAIRFHEYIKERVIKMFTPFVDGENNVLINKLPESFFEQFVFCYMDTDTPNACCMPEMHDGKVRVAITRGLLDMCDNEDEIMGVIGHEIGHRIHKFVKENKGNDMVEEATSDIIAMSHMRNAGYHPRNLQKIMRKLKQWSDRHPQYWQKDVARIFDVHPAETVRHTFNDAWLTKHAVDHVGLDNTPLDIEMMQMIKSLSVVDRVMSFLDEDINTDNLTDSMERLKSLQVFVKTYQNGLSGDIWEKVLLAYFNKKSYLDIELADDISHGGEDKHVTGLLNPAYREKFIQAFSDRVASLPLWRVWDSMADLYGDGDAHQEAYHLHVSLFNIVAGNFDFNYHNSKNSLGGKLFGSHNYEIENELPEELKICRAYIWQLLTHPETITSEALQEQRLQKPLKRLRNMLKCHYMRFNTARFLLAPPLQVKKGKVFPLYDLIQQNLMPLERSWNDVSVSELHQEPARMLLSTLGYYDTNVFYYPSFDTSTSRHNLLTSETNGIGESTLTMTDIHEFADMSYCVGLSHRGYGKYYYDLKTGIVKDVEEQVIHLRMSEKNVFGEKVEQETFSGQDKTIRLWEQEHIEPYYKDLFDKKTRLLHTRVHCDIKRRLDALAERTPDMDMFDDIEKLRTYVLNMYSSWRINFREAPFLPQNMPWYFDVANRVPAEQMIIQQNQDIETKYPTQFLFDFSTKVLIVDQILQGYLRLGKSGLTNPEMAQKIVRSFERCPYFLAGDCWYTTGEREIINSFGEKTSEPIQERLDNYIDRKYSRLFWRMFAQKPYIDFIDESFFWRLSHTDIIRIYEEAPALLSKLFDFYQPVKTGSDLTFLLQQYHRHIDSQDQKWPYWKQLHYKMLFTHIIRDYIEQGHTDVPAEVFFHLKDSRGFNSEYEYELFKVKGIEENEVGLLHNYIDNLNELENWNTNIRSAMRTMSYYSDEIVSSAERTEVADFAPKEVLQRYRHALCDVSDWREKTNLLACVWNRKDGFHGALSDNACHVVLGLDKQPHMWDRPVRENVQTYIWLVSRKAFPRNGVLQKNILNFILEQLREQTPQIREELSFLLLSSRADVSFPSLNQQFQDIWVQAVAEIMGEPDDMSTDYIARMEPYIRKLKNKRKSKKGCKHKSKYNEKDQVDLHGYTYFPLPADTQASLSKSLQEALVSQERLSYLLDVDILQNGLPDKHKIRLGGIGLNALFISLSRHPDATRSMIDFLLHEATPERVKRLEQEMQSCFDSFNFQYFKASEIEFSTEYMQNVHDIFWNTAFELRVVMLKSLFETAYGNDERIDNMINRILPIDMENRSSFYNALKNYSTAVHQDEMYEADFLLAGCLGVQPKREHEEVNVAKTIRLFLESQGPAGVKVGQFLSSHDAIPAEIRQELKQLTNHASRPSRAEVFRMMAEYHPELMDYIRQNGLGKSLGSASHYLTYELNDEEVLSVSRNQSALKAELTYERLKKALEKTLKDDPTQEHLLLIIRDAIEQAHEMNDIELNGNVGYLQMRLARRLYDHICMDIDGYHFTFKTMSWKKPIGPYHVRVEDFNTQYSQSFKIMERAHGYDYDDLPLQTEEDKRYKKAVAKANFILNLRTILAGSVFDDDRHTGQLKVQPLSGNQTQINLFDTGSMSIRTPRRADMRLFGQALYKTMRALMTLSESQEKDKINVLKALFPKSRDIDKFLTTPKEELLSFCFNSAVYELRDEKTGRVSSYISKVERALANLTHFSSDIPSDEIVPLSIQLLRQTGHIHPEIIAGMGTPHFELEQEIIQTVMPQGALDVGLIQKETSSIDKPLTKAIDDVLTTSHSLGLKDRMAYNQVLVKMLFMPKDVFPLDHIHACMKSVQNPQVRQLLSRNLCQLGKSFIQAVQSGRQTSEMTQDVITYLSKTGLPDAFAQQISARLPLIQVPLFRLAFIRRNNKLTFFERPIQRMLTQTITDFTDKWAKIQDQLMTFVQTTTDILSVGEVDTKRLKDCDLPTGYMSRNGKISNDVIKIIRDAHTQK